MCVLDINRYSRIHKTIIFAMINECTWKEIQELVKRSHGCHVSLYDIRKAIDLEARYRR